MICNPCTNLRFSSAFALFGFSIPDTSAMFHRKMSRFPFLVSCDFSPFLIKERGRETNQSRNGEFSQLENKKVKMCRCRHRFPIVSWGWVRSNCDITHLPSGYVSWPNVVYKGFTRLFSLVNATRHCRKTLCLLVACPLHCM